MTSSCDTSRVVDNAVCRNLAKRPRRVFGRRESVRHKTVNKEIYIYIYLYIFTHTYICVFTKLDYLHV